MSNYTVSGGNAESNRKGLLLATAILMSDKTGTNQDSGECCLPDLFTTTSWGRFSLGEAARESWGRSGLRPGLRPGSPGRRIPRWINSSLLVRIEIFLSRPAILSLTSILETMRHCVVTPAIVRSNNWMNFRKQITGFCSASLLPHPSLGPKQTHF